MSQHANDSPHQPLEGTQCCAHSCCPDGRHPCSCDCHRLAKSAASSRAVSVHTKSGHASPALSLTPSKAGKSPSKNAPAAPPSKGSKDNASPKKQDDEDAERDDDAEAEAEAKQVRDMEEERKRRYPFKDRGEEMRWVQTLNDFF